MGGEDALIYGFGSTQQLFHTTQTRFLSCTLYQHHNAALGVPSAIYMS